MEDLSLHILDIVENSINAGASKIRIKIIENVKKNLLLIEIADNGKGMEVKCAGSDLPAGRQAPKLTFRKRAAFTAIGTKPH